MIFVRPRAWWYNKIPLSVLMSMLLTGENKLTLTFLPLVGLIGTVCSVANYGYALNELFDKDEDRRGGRANEAETVSNSQMWLIILLSATSALGLAMASAGIGGTVLVVAVLLLPLAYSVPPVRVKERGWLGVFSDAIAAHVFPAILATMIAAQWLRSPTLLFVLAVLVWSFATGLRGILSHQLQSEEHDSRAGLRTVVHQIGHKKLKSFVVLALLPLEVLSFATMILQAEVTLFFKITAGIFLIYEFVKFHFNVFPVTVFTKKGEPYIPFVDEAAYKVWGPLALTINAAFSDFFYLTLIPVYIYLFWPIVFGEWRRLRNTGGILLTRITDLIKKLQGSKTQ